MTDNVKHPPHYTSGQIEVWDFIVDQKLDYLLGNVVKYVTRAGKKDPDREKEDLLKAEAYIQKKLSEFAETTENAEAKLEYEDYKSTSDSESGSIIEDPYVEAMFTSRRNFPALMYCTWCGSYIRSIHASWHVSNVHNRDSYTKHVHDNSPGSRWLFVSFKYVVKPNEDLDSSEYQRDLALDVLISHPAFDDIRQFDGKLLNHMMARLDELYSIITDKTEKGED